MNAAFNMIGFRQTGSFRHGTGVRGYTDIDLLANISYTEQPASSYEALTRVKAALALRFPLTAVRISRPAVVVDFAGGAQRWEVLPGFTTGADGVFEIPSPESGAQWIQTSPDAHFKYVNDANSRVSGAKALARLLKAWKYLNGVPMSSFYLEMSAARYMNSQKSFIAVFDVAILLEQIYDRGLAPFVDPTNNAGTIEAASSATNLAVAKSAVLRGMSRANLALEAYQAEQLDDAFSYLDMLYNGKFPSR